MAVTPEERFVDAWMAERGIEQFNYDDAAGDEVAGDWIKSQGPDAWHKYAISFNWDFGSDVARWIIDQPGCDKGTALWVYYAAQPHYYAQYDSVEAALADHGEPEIIELMTTIAANWAKGLYATYLYYPGVSAEEMVVPDAGARLEIARAVPWPVPEDMATTEPAGEMIQWDRTADGFSNGIGRALDDAIQARFEPYVEAG